MARRALVPNALLAASLAGCFHESGVEGSMSAEGSPTSAETGTTIDPTAATTPSSDASVTSETVDSSTGPDASSTGDTAGGTCLPAGAPQAPSCGDGIATPGELCFAPFSAVDAPGVGSDIVLADVDADSDADVITAIGDPGLNASVRIDLNDGGELVDPRLGDGPPGWGIAVAELDGMPGLDVAVAGVADTGLVFSGPTLVPGRGGGLMTAGRSYLRAAAVDELDAIDLVAASDASEIIDVLSGDGTGAFVQDGAAANYLPAGEFVVDLEVAQLTKNPAPDFLVTTTSGRLLIVPNPYPAPTEPIELATPDVVALGLAIGDVADDPAPEIAVAVTDSVLVFFPAQGWVAATFDVPGPRDVAIADMDRDLFGDLVVLSSGGAEIAVLRGNGTGDFGEPLTFPLPAAGDCSRLAVAGLDDDCVIDVAVVCGGTGEIVLLHSDP